jgi:Lhr-like helicase
MVHHLKGAAGAVKEILHYFPSKTDLPVSLIFVNSRTMGQLIHQTLWEYIDPSVRGQIHFYHAFRGSFAKEVLEEGFRTGVFCVLICTESLTMVNTLKIDYGCVQS